MTIFTEEQASEVNGFKGNIDEAGAHAILLHAGNILKRDGWQQGRMWNHKIDAGGPVCAMGAVCRAARELKLYDYNSQPINLARRHLAGRLQEWGVPYGVETWNDAPSRVQADVADLFKEAARAHLRS